MSASCAEKKHLVILGGGSAAFAAATKAVELGANVTMINDGTLGGTCVNVGCVPSKTLLRAAETLYRGNHPPFNGIHSQATLVDFKAVMEQKRQLVEALRQAKYTNVISDLPGFRLVEGRAAFTSPHTVVVNGEQIESDRFLVATGASPAIPDLPGLSKTHYLTNASAFELETLPPSLLIAGGGYIALECAQLFARLGSRVTVVQRSKNILKGVDADTSEELARHLRAEKIEIVTGVSLEKVREDHDGIHLTTRVNDTPQEFNGAALLMATGRQPNTDHLGLVEAGVKTDARGFIVADEALLTSAPNIFAAGDVIGENMFVYTAAYEGALAAENAVGETLRSRSYSTLPWVVFTDPQVGGVGLDEHQAAARGIAAQAAVLPLDQVPRAIAARDTRGFIKLIRDRETDLIIGARIVASEGGELLMQVAMAIKSGMTSREVASSFHPYLTLSEGIKLAAITFRKSVHQLSCCAV